MCIALRALKDPMSVVTRYPQPHTGNSPCAKTRPLATTSKVLAALDARKEHVYLEEDDSVEIIGSIRGTAAYPKAKVSRNLGPPKQIYSIFADACTSISSETMGNVAAANLNATTVAAESHKASKPLPNYSYKDFSPEPAIVYTQHEEEANDLVQALRGPLGFDMEWRVFFRAKAPERPTALVQVCDEHVVLLIQISSMNRFPQKLKEIIESKNVVKMGANINNDGQKLFKDYGICARNLVELGSLSRQIDPDFVQVFGSNRPIVTLAKVVERYCGKTLVKGKERTGNWEAVLGPRMIEYAANDAHCALMAYKKIMKMAAASEQTLTPCEYTSEVTPYSAPHAPGTESSSVAPTCNAPTSCSKTSAVTDAFRKPHVTFVRPQYMRAYRFWHRDNLPLETMCAQLRSKEEPLKDSTVISYVVGALQADPWLPFEMERLKTLVQMEAGSWRRHREWILNADKEGRGERATILPKSSRAQA